jgi:hypothetical protein
MTDHDPAARERFRARLYHDVLGNRRDALFQLLDAVLSGDGPEPVVRCSLAPCFRRGWASACDAVADGTLRARSLGRLCVRALPPPAAGVRGPGGVGGRRHDLAAAGGQDQPGADLGPLRDRGAVPGRGDPRLGVAVAGGGAGGAGELGVAAERRPARSGRW